jgi:hypothetical protein
MVVGGGIVLAASLFAELRGGSSFDNACPSLFALAGIATFLRGFVAWVRR